MIERIKAKINIDSLRLPEMYVLSEKGKEYISQREDLIKLQRNPYNITYTEYLETKKETRI